MIMIIRKCEIEKQYANINEYCRKTKIPRCFISKWDNKRPKNMKNLNNRYIKQLQKDGFIDTFRLVGVISFNQNDRIQYYPTKNNNKDTFIYGNGGNLPYEFLYCDFVVCNYDFNLPKVKNIIDFLNKYNIRVIRIDEYYQELSKGCSL